MDALSSADHVTFCNTALSISFLDRQNHLSSFREKENAQNRFSASFFKPLRKPFRGSQPVKADLFPFRNF